MSLPAQVTAAELHPNGAVETGERSGASELIAPHGGTLVDRQLVGEPLLAARAALPGLRHIELDLRAFADLECIATGVYSPLSGFMGAADYRSVLSEMRLANGLPWSIPITLSIAQDAAEGISAGSQIALTWRSQPLALMRVDDRFAVDLHEEAVQVYGTADTDHPGVAALMGRGGLYLGGPISLIDRLPAREFADLRLTPSQTRAEFRRRGWRSIVAFQTRNPIHRAHEYLQKTALEAVDGLFVNPLVGATKDDDVPAAVRMQSYQVILERYYPAQRTLLGVFPAAMRYAGPREAILHALARKNYGCTHFIVGRDHAGVGNYYGTYAAQEIFAQFAPAELGITPVKLEHAFYCTVCAQMATAKTCPHDRSEHVHLSGTAVRGMLQRGEQLPERFTRPEVARILADAYAQAASEVAR
ncbi:MAG TPA: sulfate adenylyltransferase [Dehalococcoidia bacterium]|nr:sulfate adenylyltransferase [Dehalococcoidia bacterium]